MAILPLYNVLALPGAKIWMRKQDYQALADRDAITGERVTLLMQKEETEREKLNAESFFPIAAAGLVTGVDQNGFITLEIQNRVNIEEIVQLPDHSFSMSISRRPDTGELPADEAARGLSVVKSRILTFSEGQQWESFIRSFSLYWDSLWTVAGVMSPWLRIPAEEKYAILAEDDIGQRFSITEKTILEGLEMMDVQSAAQVAQQQDYEKIYRESALKKQIEYLQKELDAMHPENVSEIRRLELKLEEAGMNETALKEGRKVLNRLKGEGSNSPEAGMLTDWLDLLTSLPWKKAENSNVSMEEAREALDARHAGLDKVKKRILQQIAVMRLKGKQSGSILCFVGAPGTGKTSIGESIAKALGREYVRVSLGGIRDEADIRGHRRTYIGSMPGRIMDGIHKCGSSNPVMVLDEVDKMSASYNGDPASALLEVLDPEQNFSFTDHYLNVPFDLSDVFFICTANTTDTIPEPLLNRMELISFQGYTPLEKLEIAKEHLLPRAMETMGIPTDHLQVSEDALRRIITEYTREAGVRGLKKRMDQLCRTAAVTLVDHPGEKLNVGTENLRDYIEGNPLPRKDVGEESKQGIITGLAWTPVGGEILYIQTMLTRGSGKITVTGQLGDVMKESAQIAVSLVKSMLPEQAEVFEKNDLHIHVPDGATPKDGPSAGITLTTALASLITGVSVSPRIAMTGEVSLRGDVNPIGGLPEKLMAAQRAGVRKVLIPKENVPDLEEINPEVLDQLEILPVESVAETMTLLGIPRP